MIDKAEHDRVSTLLNEALPMLCRSGLNFTSEFRVQALIGITLDQSDVILVNVYETVTSDKGGGDKSFEASVTHEEQSPGKSNRKRKKAKRKHSDASDNDSEPNYTDNDHSAIKREKMEGDDSESEIESTTNSAYGQQNVKLEPSETDFSSYSFGDQSHLSQDMSGYPQVSTHPLASSSMLSPNNESSLPSTSFAQPGQMIPNIGTPGGGGSGGDDQSGTQGSMKLKSNENTDDTEDTEHTESAESIAADFIQLQNKRWMCNQCLKICAHRSHVREHIRLVHLKLRPEICRYCKRAFGKKCHVTAHEKRCRDKPSGDD